MEILKSFKDLKDGTVLEFRPDKYEVYVHAGWGRIREVFHTKFVFSIDFSDHEYSESDESLIYDGTWYFSPDMFLKPKNTIWI